MEEHEECPPLPSNYLTLAQLQERWLKEQQERKQREKEEQNRKETEKPEQQRKREKDEGEIQKENDGFKHASIGRPAFRGNRRNQQRPRDQRKIDLIDEGKEDESQIEAIVNHDEQKADESNKRKNEKKKKSKARKPRVEEGENLTGDAAQFEPEEKISEAVTEKISQNEGIGNRFPRNGGRRSVDHIVWQQKGSVGQTASQLAQNFEDLSLNGKKEGSMKHRAVMNGGSGKFYPGKPWRRQRESNFVWVKKGDTTDADFAGARSSGKG